MENSEYTVPEQPDNTNAATDLFDEQELYVNATLGQRFLNFLLDNLFMNYVLSLASGYAFGFVMAYLFPEFMQDVINDGESGLKYWLLVFMLSYFNYIIYYTICEKAFRGYTLGKLITGTRAIRIDGAELTFKDALLRSLSRLVPFEVLSALGARPWHDSWTDTRVIKSR